MDYEIFDAKVNYLVAAISLRLVSVVHNWRFRRQVSQRE